MSKRDLVTPERSAEVLADIRRLLGGTSLAEADILPVSIATGDGVAALEARLLEAARSMPSRRCGGHFRLAVDRCFSLAGVGTIVTGTVFSGEVRPGDKVLLSPSGLAARVRGLHTLKTRRRSGPMQANAARLT